MRQQVFELVSTSIMRAIIKPCTMVSAVKLTGSQNSRKNDSSDDLVLNGPTRTYQM